MQLNIPTWLTLFRVIMMPFLILTFYLPFKRVQFYCMLIFILAAVTDWFDGFLARRWKQTTRFGAFLDPVADKIMVTISLVLVAEHFHSWWVTLPSAAIISREIIILALREWMAEIGKSSYVSVSWISKVKTTTQMFALAALLWQPDQIISWLGIVLLYVAAVLTFWSIFQYLYTVRYDLFKY